MPKTNRLVIGAVAAAFFLLEGGAAFAQKTFDTSPEQAERPHTTKGEAAALIEGADLLAEPGKLTVAVSPYLPPTGFYATDSKTVIGVNADLISLVAEKLGLELNFQVVAFPDWPLSLTSGRYDVFIGDTAITEERKLKFDFSAYGQDISGFYVANESPIVEVSEPSHIAGLKLIVSAGTAAEKIMLDWDAQNKAAGLAPVELQYFDDPAAAELSLLSGRTDVRFVNYTEGAYNAAVSGKTRLVGVVDEWGGVKALMGIVSRKDSGIAEPVTQALNELIAEGTYQQALERWSVEREAIPEALTNPPGIVVD